MTNGRRQKWNRLASFPLTGENVKKRIYLLLEIGDY
jgi:hypothetical protein